MTVAPIVERELRVAARRRGTYRSRFLTGLAAVIMAAYVGSTANEHDLGGAVFFTESAIAFIYAGIAGLMATSDSISEEKRAGTLGLLFLTDLKGRDVVLGKLAATSLNAIYGMFAVLPVLALPLLVGGVKMAEVLRAGMVALNLLFFFLCLGLASSALCRRDGRALGLGILVAAVLLIGWPLATQIGRHPDPDPHAAIVSSPGYGCFLISDLDYNRTAANRRDFWINAGVTQLYGWLCFILACVITPRAWKDERSRRIRAFWRRPISPAARALMLEGNPYVWRVARRGRAAAWGSLITAAFLWWAIGRLFDLDLFDAGKDLWILALAGLAIKVNVAMTSAIIIGEDRRTGGLELLMTTPLAAGGILEGHRQGLRRLFIAPVLVLLLVNIGTFAAEAHNFDDFAFGMHLLLGIFLLLDTPTLAEVAMWRATFFRKPERAALGALAQIIALPGIICWISMLPPIYALENHLFAIWGLIGAVIDVLFGLRARAKLDEMFQIIAAEGWGRARDQVTETVA